jgi:energy-coupling factor transport system permease protein
MLSDITLGQYFPGKSIIHKLDPRIKIISIILLVITIFCTKTYLGFGAILAFSLLLIGFSGINYSTILKSLKPVMFILAFTVIANMLWTTGETPLFTLGVIKIYPEGIIFALLMALRIVCLIITTFVLLTYTTSPVSLTDAIERLLHPLAVIKLPVHEFSMMMSIALRFIPTLLEETDKIMSAQKARGADFETGSLMKRVKALVPILVPLFVSAFRRADELANAMECRLYTGGNGRTRMKVLKLRFHDVLFLLFMAAFLGMTLYFNSIFGNVI